MIGGSMLIFFVGQILNSRIAFILRWSTNGLAQNQTSNGLHLLPKKKVAVKRHVCPSSLSNHLQPHGSSKIQIEPSLNYWQIPAAPKPAIKHAADNVPATFFIPFPRWRYV